jgi:hypothetical protein
MVGVNRLVVGAGAPTVWQSVSQLGVAQLHVNLGVNLGVNTDVNLGVNLGVNRFRKVGVSRANTDADHSC